MAYSKEIKRLAQQLYEEEGETLVAIAKRIGTHEQTVRRWMQKEKWKKHILPTITDSVKYRREYRLAFALYLHGFTYPSQICELVGISRTTLSGWQKRYDWETTRNLDTSYLPQSLAGIYQLSLRMDKQEMFLLQNYLQVIKKALQAAGYRVRK